MEKISIEQFPVTSATAAAAVPSTPAINVAALGVPVTVTTGTTSVPAPVVPITEALTSQIRERVAKLANDREVWEKGTYARSNETLYGLIGDCYALYLDLTKKDAATRYKRLGFDGYIADKGYIFKEGTPLTGKIVRCVFAGTDRRRLSTYHTVLRVAVAQKWELEQFAANIAACGGVQEISLGKASGAMTAKQKAEVAKEQVLSQVLAKATSSALSELAPSDGIGSKAVAVMTQEADGSFTIHAVVHSETAVNAALAAYFSSHKEELKVAANHVKAKEQVVSRETLIDTAAEAVVNG